MYHLAKLSSFYDRWPSALVSFVFVSVPQLAPNLAADIRAGAQSALDPILRRRVFHSVVVRLVGATAVQRHDVMDSLIRMVHLGIE
jgi:hypothetical protein